MGLERIRLKSPPPRLPPAHEASADGMAARGREAGQVNGKQ